MKFLDLYNLVEKEGRALVRQKGSHCQYQHPERPNTVTIAGHPSKDVAHGTLRSILKATGIRP